MKKSLVKSFAVTAILLFTSVAAHAVTIVTPTSLPTDTSFTVNVNGGSGGAANISFDLWGLRSLDGVNFYEDDFTLSLNSSAIFTGSFSLGGGGTNSIFSNTFGLAVAGLQPDVVTFGGGDLFISGLINLLAGNNTLEFSYASLSAGHAGFQGTGDEGWGVNNLNVSTVPLPPAALLLGTGLLALARKRRKNSAA